MVKYTLKDENETYYDDLKEINLKQSFSSDFNNKSISNRGIISLLTREVKLSNLVFNINAKDENDIKKIQRLSNSESLKLELLRYGKVFNLNVLVKSVTVKEVKNNVLTHIVTLEPSSKWYHNIEVKHDNVAPNTEKTFTIDNQSLSLTKGEVKVTISNCDVGVYSLKLNGNSIFIEVYEKWNNSKIVLTSNLAFYTITNLENVNAYIRGSYGGVNPKPLYPEAGVNNISLKHDTQKTTSSSYVVELKEVFDVI